MLAQIYYGTSLQSVDSEWLNTGDHCTWSGVTCNENYSVTQLAFNNLDLTGPYPNTLDKLTELTTLSTIGNNLSPGLVSDNNICTNTAIAADETNCPNAVDETGCCDAVRMTSPSPYIDAIVESELSSADCSTFSEGSRDSGTCIFMRNKDNHYVFDDDQYPDGFPYESWLKVRGITVMECNFNKPM